MSSSNEENLNNGENMKCPEECLINEIIKGK